MSFSYIKSKPKLHKDSWCAKGSIVVGDVKVGALSSIWFNTVLRGDVHSIEVGEKTNIQDLTMVHVTHDQFSTKIGNLVTIGHSAIIHACQIGDASLIGMGSIVMDGAEIGDYVLLGAGSLVTPGMKIPSKVQAFGRPAKVVRPLTQEELLALEESAYHYVELMKAHRTLGKKK